ncbi:MAG: globin domain-containing protein [Pseudomonadota bacterium]
MELTPHQADLLKRSLGPLVAEAGRASQLFYGHLFRLAPETEALFINDMTRQGDKLMATLSQVILRIETWQAISTEVAEMGLRHTAYGVAPEHYHPTGEALHLMLAEMLGEAYTPELREAWNTAYWALARAMIRAVEERKSARARIAPAD